MNILLTNDDGLLAEGIQTMLGFLEKNLGDGTVYVVAPQSERSASGHAITLHKPVRAKAVTHNGPARLWSVSGTPADCVKLAVNAILPERPDILISGINAGFNLGTDVFYSGTVSAAIEGTIMGIPSLAVSVGWGERTDYPAAAKLAFGIAKEILRRGLPPKVLLNLNVPPCPASEFKGTMVTSMGIRHYQDIFDKRLDPKGRPYFWLGGEVLEVANAPGTDVWAVTQGMISLTPLSLDLTRHDLLGEMKDWVNSNVE